MATGLDAATAGAFLDAVAARRDLGRLPTGEGWVCLARVAAGGEAVDVSGIGDEPEAALVRCAGEAVETLALEGPGPRATSGVPALAWGTGSWIAQVAEVLPPDLVGARLIGGPAVTLPAALAVGGLWRRGPDDPPLSEGCAAGEANAARLGAVLELVERDAVALWWRSGRPARLVAHEAAASRGALPPRRVWTLDLGAGALAPVAALVSAPAEGPGFAFAAAARATFAEARAAAARELALFELAAEVARRRPGDPRHAAHRARAAPAAEAVIGRLDAAGASRDLPAAAPLGALAERAAEAGVAVALVDLTRGDLPVAVYKAVSPDLEPSRTRAVTAQCAAARRRWGDPPAARAGVAAY